jgi:hypothetical protein
MQRFRIVVHCVIVLLSLSASAQAWNDTGHKVVARIAWDSMKPQTRESVIALLEAAPPDAGLLDLFANDLRPLPARQREFFLRTSTWADIIRDRNFPERRDKYHQSPWHYINFFWELPHPNAKPKDRKDMQPEPQNVVERLQHFQASLADPNLEQSQRAIDLAWVLHLVGDIHQPLHCSARVTPAEPEGDRGGNLFKLDSTFTLHGYWDNILSLSFPSNENESEDAYIGRLAKSIMKRHSKAKLAKKLKPGEFESWAKDGYNTTKTKVYPSSLRRNQAPSNSYRKNALKISEPAIALAGYRLAEMLDRLFGS